MNRKIHFSIVGVICVITLAACATAAPTAIQSSNDGTDQTAPTAAVNTDTSGTSTTVPGSTDISAASPTAPGNNDTSGTSTLACGNGSTSAAPIPELTEGPYFTANSPERASLYEDGMAGTKLVITGYVYTTDCQPVANALLDFWQADANGVYDNSGYILRGHQFTDSNGRYELTTVIPGIYTGRTEHIHFKVQAPNGQLITSQLFFPGVVENDSDGIFDEALLLAIQGSGNETIGQFNFVVPAP